MTSTDEEILDVMERLDALFASAQAEDPGADVFDKPDSSKAVSLQGELSSILAGVNAESVESLLQLKERFNAVVDDLIARKLGSGA